MNICERKRLIKYDPVTYVPSHVNGNASHQDCEQGVYIGPGADNTSVRVLYCTSRTVQMTDIDDLVTG